jgi:hypothetical protein
MYNILLVHGQINVISLLILFTNFGFQLLKKFNFIISPFLFCVNTEKFRGHAVA